MEIIEAKEIICWWLEENTVRFDVIDYKETQHAISINMYEFLQCFDKKTIDEIKNKLIENIKNK